MDEAITFRVVGDQPPTAADFDIALYYVKWSARQSKNVLAHVGGVAAGAKYTERSGDSVCDDADLIAAAVTDLHDNYQRARNAVGRCCEALRKQHDRLIEPKPQIGGKYYDSAHEALIAAGLEFSTAIRAWDHDLVDRVAVDRPLDVSKLRDNLVDACEWLVEQHDIPSAELIEGLLRDARYECRQAKEAAAKLAPVVSSSGTAPVTPPEPRLTVSLERKTVTLDGESFDVSSDLALRWVNVLAEHPGVWISSGELKQFDAELDEARTDRLRKSLPDSVAALIESDPGRGSRINLDVA